MSEMHYFDIKVAEKYGVNCAILLQNIWHWVRKNEANGKHFHDGHFWTYNSTKAFSDLFPYLSQRQIEFALKKLKDEGIILAGNYNEMKYDRTLWYAITEKGKCILHSCEMDFTPEGNGFTPDVKPIPYINPDTKPNNKPDRKRRVHRYKDFVPPTLEEVEEYCKKRNNHVDAKRFYDYFNASDWVDSKGNKVRNWKQKVITWESYNKEVKQDGQATGDSNKVRFGNII